MDKNLRSLFTNVLAHYTIVAQNLKVVSDTYPFKECDDEKTPVDNRAGTAIEALKRAYEAEATGLDVLSKLVGQLT